MHRSLSLVTLAAAALAACVEPTNAFDPDAPLELQAPCSLEGLVVVEGRADAGGVTVTVDGKSAVTGSLGAFSLEGLRPGRHTVRAALGDGDLFRRAEREVACPSADAVSTGVIELTLIKGDLEGSALLDGSPRAAALSSRSCVGSLFPARRARCSETA